MHLAASITAMGFYGKFPASTMRKGIVRRKPDLCAVEPSAGWEYPPSMPRRAAVARLSRQALAGCATGQAPIPPAYTQEELGERCARPGGWWRPSSPHSRFSGHCEYGGGIIR